ncbi:hypothetical protein ACWCXX_39295 [Streptomyces sp. NPDC001732]
MDSEALVGLIAAAGALLGTAIGAGGAVMAGRLQGQAARYQADVQAEAQRKQWLRGRRLDACVQLNLHYRALSHLAASCHDGASIGAGAPLSEDQQRANHDELARLTTRMNEAIAEIELGESKELYHWAMSLLAIARSLIELHHDAAYQQTSNMAFATSTRFREAVQKAFAA